MSDDFAPTSEKPKAKRKKGDGDVVTFTPAATGNDNGADESPAGGTSSLRDRAADLKTKASEMYQNSEAWREQAGKAAKSAASTAKDATGSAMHALSRLIADTAETVDGKLGPQYGDYARQAAEAVAGAAKKLDESDIDKLADDARDFVRKSPAVAIGAAAVVGFVLMRLARGSGSDEA
jgi:ElaB/YqjD/DUF883 family membrane-anchored ribosome-binding protein